MEMPTDLLTHLFCLFSYQFFQSLVNEDLPIQENKTVF